MSSKLTLTLKNKPQLKLKPKLKKATEPKVESPSLSALNQQLNQVVQNHVIILFLELLTKISRDYQLDLEELKKQYLSQFKQGSDLYSDLISTNLDSIDLHKLRNDLSVDLHLCMARTRFNRQCSRRPQGESQYCGNHIHNQPFGRIDQPIIENHSVTLETINGIDYLLDENGKIYQLSDASLLEQDEIQIDIEQLNQVGTKSSDGTIHWN